jgi:hypothetical protein
MTLTTIPIDNGINLQALLDAREALSAARSGFRPPVV